MQADEWTETTIETEVNGSTVIELWDEDTDSTRVYLSVQGASSRDVVVSRIWEPQECAAITLDLYRGTVQQASALHAALQRAIEIALELEAGE